ncbi:MAG: twin-arginine translocation signal domain-containing protein [Candidatus Vogelbacteria bacterium]|nr:twin-arginine translocation signal domain-containing protein [Candidatus Vogelbacteria bacterium]
MDPEPRLVETASAISDDKKRSFLKLAGLAGLGVAAATMLPKKANALVFGSSPGASRIGLKNSSNTPIDPATEGTLQSVNTSITGVLSDMDSIKTNTATIVTNTANLPVKGQNNMANSLPVTIASNQTPIPISGSMTFDASSKMTVDAADSLFFLRKIVKQLEPLTTVDNANRQRVTIDSSGTLTVSLSTNVVTTVAGQNQQMYQDVARNTYATGVRSNLSFT